MFCEYKNEDQPIQCFVFGVEVSKKFFIDYIVNGYHKSLIQRSSQTLVEENPLNNKKNVSKKTVCKKTVSTLIVQRFASTGVSNKNGDISNSSVTIHGCGRDYVQRRRELTLGASSSMENTHLVHLSSDEDCDSYDHSNDEQVGDEAGGDEAIRDEAVGDQEMGDDDSMDSELGKDGIEVGNDSIDSVKDLEGDKDMGGVIDIDGKLSDYKSKDLSDEIDYWVEHNIDQTEKGKMRVGLIFADVHAFRAALKDYVIEQDDILGGLQGDPCEDAANSIGGR
ncbi:hypothetical protein NE237_021690 [Protea cynaroides]|uniref:Uncharacterized protein n=1 Tax=Protea cynaroides TaxID=273540 RepID=A0A9Q0HBS6_9MAGN|nr:hypothetical protein NE237_021690 [Protea cynaroides]